MNDKQCSIHVNLPYILNGQMTPSTLRRKQFVKVVFAIGFAVLLVVVVGTQRFGALSALEALGMPWLTHRTHLITLHVIRTNH